ncbi:hypothetical protein RND81_04G146400 [Saponaria officinalis]|uniref:acid phosphatase n=1 Tax=Saponaria officinalis TaxID=3572 RepID=A0AAW1LJG5_SAPOF
MKAINSCSSIILASNVNLPFYPSSTKFLPQNCPFPQISCPFFNSSQKLNFNYPIKIHPKIFTPSSISSSSSSMASSTETKPYSVLFVCLGNICRSPAAEGVFRDLVKKRGIDSNFTIDSAGTIDYHEGNPADSRMRSTAKRRGIEITSISRPIRPSDFTEFDLILAMDKSNRADILEAFENWKKRGNLPSDADKKVKLMCSYCKRHDETEVPDPYYGGQQGFEKVLDILEDACESLLDSILTETSQT